MLDGIKNTLNSTLHFVTGTYYEGMLLHAATTGKIEAAQYALTKGADINFKEDSTGDTPLHKAAFAGQLAIVQLLLEKQARVSGVNTHQETPLHHAAINGHTDIILLLLDPRNGGKLNAKNDQNLSVVDLLIINDKSDTLKQVMQNAKKIDADQFNNLISLMLHHGKLDMALDFIEHAPDSIEIDNIAMNKNMILEHAVKNGLESKVKTLLERFHNLEEHQLNMLLNIAVNINNTAIATLLIENGASANTVESTPPILIAAQNGYTEMLEILINAGAVMTAYDSNRNNVLHLTILGFHLDAFEFLLKSSNSKLNLTKTNAAGFTPKQLLAKNLDMLTKSLTTLPEDFKTRVDDASKQVNLTNIKGFPSYIEKQTGGLVKDIKEILPKITMLIQMQAKLNDLTCKTVRVEAAPLRLMAPRPQPTLLELAPTAQTLLLSNTSSSGRTALAQTASLTQVTVTNPSPERVVGGKSVRPDEFDKDLEQPEAKKLRTSLGNSRKAS